MNIVGKLTLRHLKENKKRTIVTICGIIVSVAMITAVTTAIPSFIHMMGSVMGQDSGNWIGYYVNVDASAVEKAKNYENIADVVVCSDEGNLMAGDQMTESGSNMLSLRAQQAGSFENVSGNVVEGAYPAGPNEIMVKLSFLQQNNLDWKVGDTVTLNQIERYWSSTSEDRSKEPIRQFTEYMPEEQSVTKTGQRQFKLTGIFYSYASSEYNAVTVLDPKTVAQGSIVDLYTVQEKLSRASMGQVTDLAKVIGEYSSASTNTDLLRYNGILEANEAAALYGIGVIVMIIIMIASVTLIYNAFAISLNERNRYLGMLASVGATKKQKRATVYYEGMFIGAFGIPLGILAGIGGIWVTFQFVGPMMKEMFADSFGAAEEAVLKLVVSPEGILLSVLLSVITILISAYVPGRRASRTTPIDAIRGTKDVTASVRRLKTSKLTTKLFGYEGDLAVKNIKRNRKKYRVIIASLAISIILFLSVSSFTGMMTKSIDMVFTQEPYDISINVYNDKQLAEDADAYVKTLSGVDKIEINEQASVAAILKEEQVAKAGEDTFSIRLNNGQMAVPVTILAIDDDSFRQLCRENAIDPEPYFDTASLKGLLQNVASDYVVSNGQQVFREYNPLKIKKGDSLSVVLQNFVVSERIEEEAEYYDITAQDVVNKNILDTHGGNVTHMIMPRSAFEILGVSLSSSSDVTHRIYLYTKQYKELDKEISSHIYEKTGGNGSGIHYYNAGMARASQRQLMVVVNVFFYGFITLMTMICVANIFNTVATGINLRRREFAMIKSVGMTPKGFNRMVALESLFYGIRSLAIGLPLSVGIHVLMWQTMKNQFEMGLLASFNWWSYAVAVLAVFIIVGTALLYSVGKVRKDNIIETLKNEDN